MTVAAATTNAVAGNGKVPPAADMLSLDSRVRGNDGAVVVGGVVTDTTNAVVGTVADKVRFAQSSALDTGSSPVWSAVADDATTDDNRAAVVSTVATVGVGGGAVAATDDTVIDDTVTDTGTVKKQNFHTGLEPVSRTKNSAQPTEFNAAVGVTVTVVSDATIVANAAASKIVIPAGRRNPDARTAASGVALPWTASAVGERGVTPAAGGIADGTVGATPLTDNADTTVAAGNRRHTATVTDTAPIAGTVTTATTATIATDNHRRHNPSTTTLN